MNYKALPFLSWWICSKLLRTGSKSPSSDRVLPNMLQWENTITSLKNIYVTPHLLVMLIFFFFFLQAGKDLRLIKSLFYVSLEHCHFKLLDAESLALPLLSDPRNEQVLMAFLCCHLQFNTAGISSRKRHQTHIPQIKDQVRWCTNLTL